MGSSVAPAIGSEAYERGAPMAGVVVERGKALVDQFVGIRGTN
jgi:hypothetical protein